MAAGNQRNQDNNFLTVSQTRLYNESLRQSENNADSDAASFNQDRTGDEGGNQRRNGSRSRPKVKKTVVKVPKVNTEESLVVVLKMVKMEIRDDKFNASRRRILLTFLQSVDFKAINMTQSTWEQLIAGLRFIANQSDSEESEKALNIFADIIAARPYDTSQVIAILKPE